VSFAIEPRGPFSLAASARFWSGFAPADRPDAAEDPVLRLAFLRDSLDGAAAVALRQAGGVVEVDGDDADRAQVERILSLDVDGSAYPAVGERDPVVGQLQRGYPGLRPVLYATPYEAAAWAILSARVRGTQAVALRRRLCEEHGEAVGGLTTFPAPERLLALREVAGVNTEKLRRLHAVAEAALAGTLDAAALRASPADEALERLREIRGLGPFLSELVLLRGAGAPDVVPASAPRIRAAVAEAYNIPEPDEARLLEIAERWRPYRSWVCLLLRASE
jgi:DNA-3-methyladenine glycosylase II